MSLDAYLRLLRSEAPADVRIGERIVEFRSAEEIEADNQVSDDSSGGSGESGGRSSWLPIVWTENGGDLIMIHHADQDEEIPVSMQLIGLSWKPARIADSAANFFRALDRVRALAAGRDTPAALSIPGAAAGRGVARDRCREPAVRDVLLGVAAARTVIRGACRMMFA